MLSGIVKPRMKTAKPHTNRTYLDGISPLKKVSSDAIVTPHSRTADSNRLGLPQAASARAALADMQLEVIRIPASPQGNAVARTKEVAQKLVTAIKGRNWHGFVPRRFKKYSVRDGVVVQPSLKRGGSAVALIAVLVLGLNVLPASDSRTPQSAATVSRTSDVAGLLGGNHAGSANAEVASSGEAPAAPAWRTVSSRAVEAAATLASATTQTDVTDKVPNITEIEQVNHDSDTVQTSPDTETPTSPADSPDTEGDTPSPQPTTPEEPAPETPTQPTEETPAPNDPDVNVPPITVASLTTPAVTADVNLGVVGL
jgi:hypothetical protein